MLRKVYISLIDENLREADKNLGQMSEVFFCTLPDRNPTFGTAVKF